MMYPEMMHTIVYQHQEYLRSLWSNEPLIPGARSGAGSAFRFVRRHLGGAFVRFGFRLGGHAPQAGTIPELSPQQQ